MFATFLRLTIRLNDSLQATAFANMAGHIPDGGSCLVVFGPHVGVDSKGNVGTVERRGRSNGGPCCGSSIAASAAVAAIVAGGEKAGPPKVHLDAQQSFVVDMLLPYADRLEKTDDKMVELPYCMYDAVKKMMTDVFHSSRREVAGSGKIAVLGGIQINTPENQSDYFLPLTFEVYNTKGRKLADLTL
jgi:Limiting CO2-inducible proteins B/C beta carbonyic anhydrases